MKTAAPLLKVTASIVLLSLLTEIFIPTVAYGLTSGPAQPDFASFEPVATTGMVNEFTGGFTYNLPVVEIPGANGGGYALSLSYHSGTTMDEDASWVGYGWTLNPGAIMRGKRGFPDEFNNDTVTYYNKTRRNETYTIGYNLGIQAFSKDQGGNYEKSGPFSFGLNSMMRYNTYTGFSSVQGYSASVAGLASLGFQLDDGYGKFSASINPAALLYAHIGDDENEKNLQGDAAKLSALTTKRLQNAALAKVQSAISSYGVHMLTPSPYPTNSTKYDGASYNIRFGVTVSPIPWLPGELGGHVGIVGSYTYQQGVSVDEQRAYGYMYSGEVNSSAAVMDYFTEKETPFTKKDRYLGIPFSNADVFSLTGEGLNGGFRLHNKRTGMFRPNSKHSEIGIYDVGFELGVGTAVGFGANISAGRQTLDVRQWGSSSDRKFASHKDIFTSSGGHVLISPGYDGEPYFFRFNNDMGGRIEFSSSDEPYRALIVGKQPVVEQASVDTVINNGQRSGRSSYIAYNTNEEVYSMHSRHYAPEYINVYDSYVNRYDPKITKGLGEIAVFNEDGLRYVYALPVYSRKERNMQFALENPNLGGGKNVVAYSVHEDDANAIVSGEKRSSPYASMFLLTDITTPDYIDRTRNGPTSDDFGGYTKFTYKRTAGTPYKTAVSNQWYKWRSPYVGLNYSTGKLSDGRDDRGVVASGEKEVYYLSTVDTKTHVAFFITNKTDTTITLANGQTMRLKGSLDKERLDGYEAYRGGSNEVESEKKSAGEPWVLQTGSDGQWDNDFNGKTFAGQPFDISKLPAVKPNKLEYLERIELFAKNDLDQITGKVKTVHFEYDYSVMQTAPSTGGYPGVLNSAIGFSTENVPPGYVGAFRYGKLTLRKVWFEYEGVINSTISPYTFDYQYKKSSYFSSDIVSRYGNIVRYADTLREATAATNYVNDENPPYNSNSVDRWGSYRYYSEGYGRSMALQPYTNQKNSQYFDPAAWQLKVVTLPSGGQIHVQYEQHDYNYVQDRPAMAMVGLSGQGIKVGNKMKYYLKTNNDLNIATGTAEMDRLVATMKKQFVEQGEKIYFKFLYQFKECSFNVNSTSFPTSGVNDYVTGYCDVADVGADAGGVWVELKGDILPNDLAAEYAKVNKTDKLSCNATYESGKDYNSRGFWLALLGLLPGFPSLYHSIDALFGPTAAPYYNFSYIRIPISTPKKGGGIRVKRIFMYDDGLAMEANNAVLYGSEYIYRTEENGSTISSGVATNEPMEGREENSLVRFLVARDERNFVEKIAAGKDLEQFEGPIGESLLPSPSIGYSKVIVKNIYDGETGTGFSVTEYATARDYPMIVRHTAINQQQETPNPFIDIFTNMTTSKYWLTQGYSFILNNMHGQPKKVASYGGQYADKTTWYEVESRVYDYYKPGEKVPMMYKPDEAFVYEQPGKEMEVIMEGREIIDITDNYSGSFDAGFSLPGLILFPLPFGTFSFVYSSNHSELHTHVTTKVIQYPTIAKGVQTFKNGIYHTEEHLAFDPATGSPVVSLSYDGYDNLRLGGSSTEHKGAYAAYTFPAYQQVSEMGQKALYDRKVVRCVFNGSYLSLFSGSQNPFHTGDLLRITHLPTSSSTSYLNENEESYLCHVSAIDLANNIITLASVSYKPSLPSSVAEVNSYYIEILRSGRTNQLKTPAGGLVTYGRTKAAVLNGIIADSTTQVVSATATTFSDNWLYDESVFGSVPADYNSANAYQKGTRGKWRPEKSYVYRQNTKSAVASASDRVYADAGVLNDFSFFNWSNPQSNSPNWLNVNTVTQYSPHGEPIEETNILGIPSAARFAHKNMMPAIVAQNAQFGSIFFDSFEDGHGSSPVGTAHSGSLSRLLLTSGWYTVAQLDLSTRTRDSGLSIKYWVKSGAAQPCSVRVGGGSILVPQTPVAQTGEWKLFELVLQGGVLSAGSYNIEFKATATDVYLDDIRVQPLNAQATCYVYDKNTLRLITQFDDQHFGVYYQYNGEGKLVRNLRETERGLKTVKEAQYHVPLVGTYTSIPYNPALLQGQVGNNTGYGNNIKDLDRTHGVDGKVDMLQMNITPDTQSIRILGQDSLPNLPRTTEQQQDSSQAKEQKDK